jgi:hypothetical protein
MVMAMMMMMVLLISPLSVALPSRWPLPVCHITSSPASSVQYFVPVPATIGPYFTSAAAFELSKGAEGQLAGRAKSHQAILCGSS